MRWSDRVQHLSAVHQRILRLERVGEPVELLEPGIGVVLAVLGVTGNLDGDHVLGDVVPPLGANAARNIRAVIKAPRALYSRQRGSSRSADSRSYSAACSARMWLTMTSSSLMAAASLVAHAPILTAGLAGGQSAPDSTLQSAQRHEIRLIESWGRRYGPGRDG